MLDEPVVDLTAGEQARQIRLHPERPQPILDPTDPRTSHGDRTAGRDEPEQVEAGSPEPL